jgi:hypothetical protein
MKICKTKLIIGFASISFSNFGASQCRWSMRIDAEQSEAKNAILAGMIYVNLTQYLCHRITTFQSDTGQIGVTAPPLA